MVVVVVVVVVVFNSSSSSSKFMIRHFDYCYMINFVTVGL